MEAPFISIEGDRGRIDALHRAVVDVIQSDNSDQVKVAALETLRCTSGLLNTVSNCNFNGGGDVEARS